MHIDHMHFGLFDAAVESATQNSAERLYALSDAGRRGNRNPDIRVRYVNSFDQTLDTDQYVQFPRSKLGQRLPSRGSWKFGVFDAYSRSRHSRLKLGVQLLDFGHALMKQQDSRTVLSFQRLLYHARCDSTSFRRSVQEVLSRRSCTNGQSGAASASQVAK